MEWIHNPVSQPQTSTLSLCPSVLGTPKLRQTPLSKKFRGWSCKTSVKVIDELNWLQFKKRRHIKNWASSKIGMKNLNSCLAILQWSSNQARKKRMIVPCHSSKPTLRSSSKPRIKQTGPAANKSLCVPWKVNLIFLWLTGRVVSQTGQSKFKQSPKSRIKRQRIQIVPR